LSNETEQADLPVPPRFDRARFGAESASWQCVRSEIVADCRVFRVRRDWSVSPQTGQEHDFYVLTTGDWINVIPLTADDEVVMIEQYRHGSGDVTLEIPGGMVDEGETPRDAAARETLEETLVKAPKHEATEHTSVRLVPLADIPQLIADGLITHALVVAAFHWLTLWQQNLLAESKH
jgi:hypothetical protein